MAASDYVTDVQGLYVAYYGRWADVSGLDYWTRVVDADDGDLDAMINQFGNSDEYLETYSSYLDGEGEISDAAGLVNELYQNAFGRDAEETGQQFYVDLLDSGESTIAEIALDIFNGATGDDAAVLDNKVKVAESATADLDATSADYAGAEAIAEAQTILESVDASGTSVVAAQDAAANAYGNANPGETFTLTTGVDSPAATDNDDTFNGVNGSAETLTAADIVDGKGGTDRLNLTLDANASTVATSAISNVENFYLRELGDGTTVDFGTVAGEEQVWSDRSTQTVTLQNLGTDTVIGVNGDENTELAGVVFDYATATDAINLAVAGGVRVAAAGVDDFVDDGAPTSTATEMSISSTGAANTIGQVDISDTAEDLQNVTVNAATGLTINPNTAVPGIDGFDGAEDTLLTISGDGAVDVSLLDAGLDEVNASANTGGVTLTRAGAGQKVTGGSGDDVIGLAAAPTDDVAGGEGSDTLIVDDDADIDTTAEQDFISGFETIRGTEAAAFVLDASAFSDLTNVQVAGDSNFTVNSIADETVQVIGDGVGDVTVDVTAAKAGGSDAFTLNLDNSVLENGDGVDAGAIAAADIDNLTINSVGGNLNDGEVQEIGSITGANNSDLEVLTVTGDTDLSVTTGASTLDTVNAADFTGAFTLNAAGGGQVNVTGGSGDDNLTGSGNADVIDGGAGNTVLTGGDGQDDVTLTDGGDDIVVLDGIVANANADTVTGFTAGEYTEDSGVDRIAVEDAQATTNFAADTAELQEVTSAPSSTTTFTTANDNVLELAFDLAGDGGTNDLDNSTDGTELLAALGQTLSVSNDAELGYIAAYQGGNAYLFHAEEGGDGDADLAATDIALVGTFEGVGVGELDATNFIDLA
jgi:hypothetical protein